MPSNVLPSEGCVFRLDSRDGYRQQFPMTFNNVGLSDDGFAFDGTSSYIVSPIDNKYNFDYFSIECVFTPSETMGDDFYGVISTRHSWGVDKVPFEIAQYKDELRCYVYSSSFKDVRYDVVAGNTYHIVFIFDGSNLKLYYNGELVYTTEKTDGVPTVLKDIYIGRRADAVTYSKGTIKNVSIYNRALTATEVKQRYKEQTFRLE